MSMNAGDTTVAVHSRSRREFVRLSALATTGLLLGDSLLVGAQLASPASGAAVPLNAWLRVGTDDVVTIIVSQAEIGQGTSTTLAAVIADELGADWARVRFENAPADPAYRNPRLNWQFTGNSESITSFFDLMRRMGAAARVMLIETAAGRWQVAANTCDAIDGRVVHMDTGRHFAFGALVADAATRTAPADPPLRAQDRWRLIGRTVPRVEIPDKVMGRAIFGIDVQVPGMVHAALLMGPAFGATPIEVDRSAIGNTPGLIDVITLPDVVAVVAEKYWHARQALGALRVRWKEGPHALMDSESLDAQYRAAVEGDRWVTVRPGAAGPHAAGRHAMASAAPTEAQIDASVVSAEYRPQFLAHATMEPMNATVQVTAEGCEVWAPTQGQELTQAVVAQVLGLPKERVRVHRTLAGGGFGRRLLADFVVAPALLSKAVGRAVKVIWSREDDMRHDFYRPATRNHITARVDASGRAVSMWHRLVSPTQLQHVFPPAVKDGVDPTCLEGLLENPYDVADCRVDFHLLTVGVPTSVLRTTGYGPNLFAVECFIDELAARALRDPWAYRRTLLAKQPRGLAVLDRAIEASGWRTPRSGRSRGLAFAHAFGTWIAQVVELSVRDGVVTLHRITTALDPGLVLDPGNATSQIEGGIAWGVTTAFKSDVTFAKGGAVQGNWHDYPIATLTDMPACETVFVQGSNRPDGGIGEVSPVTVVPAIVNAIAAATGRRLRSLPLSRHGLRLADRNGTHASA